MSYKPTFNIGDIVSNKELSKNSKLGIWVE